MGESSSRGGGFEAAFKLVGGCGRFQWFCLVICSVQLLMMTWNHMGYIFIGAVPKHWCHIQELEQSTWTLEQRKNISIPLKTFQSGNSHHPFKYDECHFYNVNYTRILEQSRGDFEFAYTLVHSTNGASSLPTQGCHRWSYDKSIYLSTIVSEFDLVCGRRYLVATIQASYMIGAFLGTLVFGPLNDRVLGRRKSTLVAILFVIIGGFLTSFATSYLMFIMTRLLVAIGTAGCMQATSVWFLEHCDTKSRARMYCISGMCFGVGYALLPVYAYFIREWSNLQLAFSITTLSLLSFYWLFPESPRWLASNGRDAEAVQALERIARINRMPKPSRADLLQVVQHCHANDQAQSREQCSSKIPLAGGGEGGEDNGANNGALDDNHCENRRNKGSSSTILRKVVSVIRNFASLLKTRELRRISFTMWALFVAVAFVYYGFAFTTNLTTNPYLLVSLGALMEVPASVLPIPFLSKWGRRPTTVACYLLTGLAALSIAITPSDQESARTILSMIGKLFVASAFTVLYLVVSEVYPTVARSTGQGAGTLMGRVGSIGAPYVADLLTVVYPDLPCIIFGVVSLLAALIALLIPEMKDVDMKDQIYEYKDSSKKEQDA